MQYAREDLLDFMFRHGHYNDACLLFFPPDGAPPPPQPSSIGTVTSSSSPQRPDSLVTDYGTIDSLCELCIGYGAMSVLEEVISVRISSSASLDAAVNKYTEAALAKICNYCETHKHFNYLYKFLVNQNPSFNCYIQRIFRIEGLLTLSIIHTSSNYVFMSVHLL